VNCDNSCSIDLEFFSDYDCMGFQSVHYYKAKKEYQCEECHKSIKPGDKYKRTTCSNDGAVFTTRQCLACADIADKLFCDGYWLGLLWEDFGNFIEMIYDEGRLEKWITCAQAKLTEGRDIFFEKIQDFIDNKGMRPALYWEKYWGINLQTKPDWSISLFNAMYARGKRVWWDNGEKLILTNTNLPAFQVGGRALVSVSAWPIGPVNLLSIMPEEALI
jgi:hypothetical protein